MAAVPCAHGGDARRLQPRGCLVLLSPSLSHLPTGPSAFRATETQPSHWDFKEEPGNISPKRSILEARKRRHGRCPAVEGRAAKLGSLSRRKSSSRWEGGSPCSPHLLPEIRPGVLSPSFVTPAGSLLPWGSLEPTPRDRLRKGYVEGPQLATRTRASQIQ